MRYVCYTFYDSSKNNKILGGGGGWSINRETIINASLWSYEGVAIVHIILSSLFFLATIWHWVFWDLELFRNERTGKPSLDLAKKFGIHLFLSEVFCFGFRAFHVTGLFGRGIWVSNPYGLIEKVQPVAPTWGAKGFDPFVSRRIAFHYIVADILGILTSLFQPSVRPPQ